jgi:DNA-binding transcriptional regulator YiaG
MKAEELKHYRDLHNLSQSELAKEIGTNKARISEWENGKHEISSAYERLLKNFFKEKEKKS